MFVCVNCRWAPRRGDVLRVRPGDGCEHDALRVSEGDVLCDDAFRVSEGDVL